jgi:hypothetical protein
MSEPAIEDVEEVQSEGSTPKTPITPSSIFSDRGDRAKLNMIKRQSIRASRKLPSTETNQLLKNLANFEKQFEEVYSVNNVTHENVAEQLAKAKPDPVTENEILNDSPKPTSGSIIFPKQGFKLPPFAGVATPNNTPNSPAVNSPDVSSGSVKTGFKLPTPKLNTTLNPVFSKQQETKDVNKPNPFGVTLKKTLNTHTVADTKVEPKSINPPTFAQVLTKSLNTTTKPDIKAQNETNGDNAKNERKISSGAPPKMESVEGISKQESTTEKSTEAKTPPYVPPRRKTLNAKPLVVAKPNEEASGSTDKKEEPVQTKSPSTPIQQRVATFNRPPSKTESPIKPNTPQRKTSIKQNEKSEAIATANPDSPALKRSNSIKKEETNKSSPAKPSTPLTKRPPTTPETSKVSTPPPKSTSEPAKPSPVAQKRAPTTETSLQRVLREQEKKQAVVDFRSVLKKRT